MHNWNVKGITLKKNDYVVSAIYTNKNDDFVVVTSRNTVKRMKVEDVILTKRSRAGQRIIKNVKANPYQVIDAEKLTPNQYKENVPIYLVYKNGNDQIDAFSLKYNVSDSGKQIETNVEGLNELLKLLIKEPSKADVAPSPDYLEEQAPLTVFDSYDDMVDEKPIMTPKSEKQGNIFDELDAILAKETGKPINPTVSENSESDDKKNEKIKYTKISLFDDDNN